MRDRISNIEFESLFWNNIYLVFKMSHESCLYLLSRCRPMGVGKDNSVALCHCQHDRKPSQGPPWQWEPLVAHPPGWPIRYCSSLVGGGALIGRYQGGSLASGPRHLDKRKSCYAAVCSRSTAFPHPPSFCLQHIQVMYMTGYCLLLCIFELDFCCCLPCHNSIQAVSALCWINFGGGAAWLFSPPFGILLKDFRDRAFRGSCLVQGAIRTPSCSSGRGNHVSM